MFFSIKKKNKDDRFIIHHQLDEFSLSLDCGWDQCVIDNATVFYKGYCDHCALKDTLVDFVNNPRPQHHGNFCVIIYKENSFTVTHDVHRKFPIWNYENNLLTSLSFYNHNRYDFTGSKIVNGFLEFGHDKEFVVHGKYVSNFGKDSIDYVDYQCHTPSLSDNIKLEYLNILRSKANSFVDHPYQKKVYLSGGYDSMILYSLIEKGCNHADIFFDTEIIEYDEFLEKNHVAIKQHGHEIEKSLHHWKDKTILTSGFQAEFYLFKHTMIVATWCAYKNINFVKEFSNYNSYVTDSFLREDRKLIFKAMWNQKNYLQEKYPDPADFKRYLVEIAINNHQHFHLGNTLTWTPLKDMRLLQLSLALSDSDIIDQFLNNSLEKYIIKSQNKNLLNYISKTKNVNIFENFINFPPFENYVLTTLRNKNHNEISYIMQNIGNTKK